MTKDTIIFDLDGTLLNTLEDLHTCFNKAITEYGYQERTIKEIKSFVGNGIKTAIEKALPNNVDESELNKIVDYFRIYYEQHMFEKTRPYEGILNMLEELKSKNYKLAIVSNKYDIAVKKLCNKYFGEYIKVAIGEYEGICKKPAKDGVMKAITELKSTIEHSIYIGDSNVDIETAKNAGIPCVSVLWGFQNKDFLIDSGGKFFAEKPKDIIQIINFL